MPQEKAQGFDDLLPPKRPLDPKWTALAAAMLGFLLDAMDVLLYVFALGQIRQEFGLSNAQAGMAMAATMLASAVGGIGAGVLSDRIGRRPTLMLTSCSIPLARRFRPPPPDSGRSSSGAPSSASASAANGPPVPSW